MLIKNVSTSTKKNSKPNTLALTHTMTSLTQNWRPRCLEHGDHFAITDTMTISCYTGAATPLSQAGGSTYTGGMDYSDIGGQLEGFDDCMDLQSFGCFPDLANPLFPLTGGQPPKSN